MIKINRRDFLKAVGAGSTATAAGCSTDPLSWDPMVPTEKAYPYIVQPEQIIPGTPTYFATACEQCSTGCGIVAKVREGRVVFIEGNKKHPIGKGSTCFRGIAGLQETYSPDRVSLPTRGGTSQPWPDTLTQLVSATNGSIAWIGRPRTGASSAIVEQFMSAVNGTMVYWEPLGGDSLIEASRQTFGVDAKGNPNVPSYHLEDAEILLSFGADFLNTWGSSYSHGWATGRDPEHGGFVSKMYTVGPRIGRTEAMTDIHFSLDVGKEIDFAWAVAKALADKKNYNGPAKSLLTSLDADQLLNNTGVAKELFDELIASLSEKLSIVFPGGPETSHSAMELTLATFVINEVAGNVGKTLKFEQTMNMAGKGQAKDVLDILKQQPNTLFIDRLDLVYAFASDADIPKLLSGIKNVILFSDEPNDSVSENTLHLPIGSSLERWGDNESMNGIHTIQQAVMTTPNGHETMSVEDILLSLAQAKNLSVTTQQPQVSDEKTDSNSEMPAEKIEGSDAPQLTSVPLPQLGEENFSVYLKNWWESVVYTKYRNGGGKKEFRDFWLQVLQEGGYYEELPAAKVSFQLASLPKRVEYETQSTGDLDLILFPHPYVADGRHANRPWAREVPEPLSGFSWDSWIEVHPETAEKIGLKKDKGAVLKTDSGSLNVGWFGSPGMRRNAVSVVMGGGKANSGRYAKYGSNPLSIIKHRLDPNSGEISYTGNKATVLPSDERNAPNPQNGLVKSDTLSTNDRYVNFTTSIHDYNNEKLQGRGSIVPEHHLPDDSMAIRSRNTPSRYNKDEMLTDMYPAPEHPTYRFAMAIDLNKCDGCGACEAACYAENNIPVVGPEQIRLGRSMGWTRLSRYWNGQRTNKYGEKLPEHIPDIRFQPVMCQQCTHAPCEGVCPVLATYHNLDGLNAMIYNRCVGTRYCGNNCPYSARRFNFHSYRWPESFNLMLNPDVVVREMGVMEKCTFCIQRIRDFKDKWRDEQGFAGQGKPSDADYNQIAVCSSACPSGAITFGNLKDKESVVYAKFQDRRSYALLGELNNKPGVAYLTRIVHTESQLHHGGEHHGDEHHESSHGAHGNSHDSHNEKEHH